MEPREYQSGADNSDVHLITRHQQTLQKLQEHLQQPEHQQQQTDGHVQQSQQVAHPQQQLQQNQQPVFRQERHRHRHQQEDKVLEQKDEKTLPRQALPETVAQPVRDALPWKQCAKCNLQFPVNMLKIQLEDCLTSGDVKGDGSDLRVCSTALYVCSICAKISNDLSGMRTHEQSHNINGDPAVTGERSSQPATVFMCSPCGLTFATSDDLINHLEVHMDNVNGEKRACCICGKVFWQPVSLLQHLDTYHGHVKACPCGAIFPAKQDFRSHQEHCLPVLRDPTAATEGPKSYRCRLCPKVFGTVQSRLQHERIHRRDSSNDGQPVGMRPLNKTQVVITCTLCKQEFNSKENYRAHVRSHTGEKPYGCRHCLKSFSSLQGRWQHEKIHKR